VSDDTLTFCKMAVGMPTCTVVECGIYVDISMDLSLTDTHVKTQSVQQTEERPLPLFYKSFVQSKVKQLLCF